MPQSSRPQADSPIREQSSSSSKVNHSVTSVLANSQDCNSIAADSADSAGWSKASRSKTKKVLAKFADVLTEHFTSKGSRKGDKPTDTTELASSNSETTTQTTVHGIHSSRLTLRQSSLSHASTGTRPTPLVEDSDMNKAKVKKVMGRPNRCSATARKRLTVVNEVDAERVQGLEDPFSESSSAQSSNPFSIRLRSSQCSRRAPTPTDPFQADNILESNVDAILLTPPVGCSTPRRQSRTAPAAETPTKALRRNSGDGTDLTSLSASGSSVQTDQYRQCSSIPRPENQMRKGTRNRGSTAVLKSQTESSVASDLTRLSSYPRGSTIRHVPRSMGRLTESPALPVPAVERTKAVPLRSKRHPSPSKGQLELLGKVMEKSLALGVFRDVDELGMSFNSPQPDTRILSPRDTNRRMQSMGSRNTDSYKDYNVQRSLSGLGVSRSRIPQPVRQLSRSRTDTALVRNFIPARKGDSTAGDELQWDISAYKIRPRCNQSGNRSQAA